MDNNIFDILWKLSIEKHEAISKQIQNTLCELTRFLKKPERDYIYNKILSLPKNKFDLETLNFAKSFSKDCIILLNHEKIKKLQIKSDQEYGVELMMKFIMDEVEGQKNDISTIEACLEHLKDLFGNMSFNEEMIKFYFLNLFENIKRVKFFLIKNFRVIQLCKA